MVGDKWFRRQMKYGTESGTHMMEDTHTHTHAQTLKRTGERKPGTLTKSHDLEINSWRPVKRETHGERHVMRNK